MNKKLITTLTLSILIISTLLFLISTKTNLSPTSFQTATIGNNTYQIEIVTTKQDMAIGLSKYKSLPVNQGMLFKFDDYGYHNFWMKNMNFDIDIIWLKNNKVVDIDQAYYTKPYKIIKPPRPINAVLELNINSPIQIGQTLNVSKT